MAPKKRKFNPDDSKATDIEVQAVTEDLSFNSVTSGKQVQATIRVRTFGGGLRWHKILCPKDSTLVSQKRSKYHKRSDLELRLKNAGGFLYAVCWIDKTKNSPKGAKCPLCGTWYQRAAVYKTLDGKTVIGTSGVDCLIEILRSLNIPNVEAVAKAAKEESLRIDKHRKIMKKINDFKTDFPGVYEHREWLRTRDNPYSRIWWEITHQIGANNNKGIEAPYLEACERGDLDRTYKQRGRYGWSRKIAVTDKSARRIPSWLVEVSQKTHDNDGQKLSEEKLREELYEMSYSEDKDSPFHRERPTPQTAQQPQPGVGATGIGGRTRQPVQQPQPKPQTVVPPTPAQPDDDLTQKAKDLQANGFDWSDIVNKGAKGEVLTKRQKEFIEQARKNQQSVSLVS